MSSRIRRFLLIAFLGLITAFSFSGPFAQWVGAAPGEAAPSQAQVSTAESFLQTGIQHYEAEQFAAAIEVWRQALTMSEGDSDSLYPALLQSNLSLAHQHLGQWRQAEAALSNSLDRLESWEKPRDSAYLETFAKALNTQGRLQWSQREWEAALETWRRATIAYSQAGHVRGIVLSLINQVKVLEAQGLHIEAKELLEQQVYPILQRETLDPMLKATGFWQLGKAQRRIGELSDSLIALQKSFQIAEEFHLESLQRFVKLEEGNTERALAKRARAIGKMDQAKRHADVALKAYQQSEKGAAASLLRQAKLNQLSLLIEAGELSKAAALWPTLDMTNLSLSRTAIYTQLNLAKSLTKLKQESESGGKVEGTPDWVEIGERVGRAVRQAKALKDPIAESYALGQLGELYEFTGQWRQAQTLTQQALRLAESAQYLDGRYRWEWQLGRLLRRQEKLGEAISAYREAVDTLELVRNDLLFIDADIQFSFRDNVEPIYRELVELLLSSEDTPEPSQENLAQAIRRIDNLQLNELENFLRCNLTPTVEIRKFEADPTAAILYPIVLAERLTVILALPGDDQLRFHQVMLPQADIEDAFKQLRRNLSEAPNRTPIVLPAAQQVYQWLIEPFESALAQTPQIKTLVFVLDGPLRNLPMAVLYDGDRYLIEKYAIAVAPRLDLFNPIPLSRRPEVFVGGIGEPQTIEGRTFSKIEKLRG